MGNRIIKESVCTSETIDELSWFEEVFFYRLMVNCDDYGRYDARLKILKSRLFPLKNITESQIESALSKLASVGIVSTYMVEEKPFLQITTWELHQTIRNKRSKFPPMDKKTTVCNQLQSIDCNCVSNPIRIQSESESELLSGGKSSEPPVVTITLNTKDEFPIHENQVNEWKKLYPNVDVMQQLRSMKGWCDANPKRRKTKNGILKFVNGWLSREQDKGSNKHAVEKNANVGNFKQRQYTEEQLESFVDLI